MRTGSVRTLAMVLMVVLVVASCGPGPANTAPAHVTATASPLEAAPPSNSTAIPPTALPASSTPAPTPGSTEPAATEAPATATALPPTTLPASSTPAPTSGSTTPAPGAPSTPAATEAPAAGQPIGPENAGRVALLARLGRGALQDAAWLPGGGGIVVAHYAGLSLHDPGTLDEQLFFPALGWKAGMAPAPDGHHVALIAEGGVHLWDVAGGRMLRLPEPAGGIKKVAWGASGETLAVLRSALVDGEYRDSVEVLDLSDVLGGQAGEGRLLYRLDDFATAVSGLAFSPDGRVLVTSLQANWRAPDGPTLALWDAASGQPLPLEGDWKAAPGGLQELAFSPDGRWLAGATLSTLLAWETAGGALLASLENGAPVAALAWSADGRLLAAGSSDAVARVWDVAAGTERATIAGHTAWVIRVAFDPAASPGGALLATASARDGVQLWAADTGRRVAHRPQAGHTDAVTALAYSPDGRLLATASTDETIRLWDGDGGELLATMDAAGMGSGGWCACFWSLAFGPDGETLAAGSTDAVVRLWSVETGELLGQSGAPTDLVHSLAFSADGRRLAAGDGDGLLWAWDLAAPLSAGPLLSLDNPPTVLSLSFDPSRDEGEYVVAAGSGFGAIRVWDLEAGALLREMQASGNSVRAVYSPDGALLAAGSGGYEPDYAVRLWDVARGEVRQVLSGHEHDVNALAFSPDDRLLASGDAEGGTRLWDVASGDLLQALDQGRGVYGLAFRPDGRRLASAGFDGLVWIWGVPGE